MTAMLFLGTAAPSHAAAKSFKNCTELNKAYPHGMMRGDPVSRDSAVP